jgi:hypothetical protein
LGQAESKRSRRTAPAALDRPPALRLRFAAAMASLSFFTAPGIDTRFRPVEAVGP